MLPAPADIFARTMPDIRRGARSSRDSSRPGVCPSRGNLFLVLDGVDGVDHGSPETLALQLRHTDDGRAAGRADGILHHGGMLPRGELQLSRTDDIWLAMR